MIMGIYPYLAMLAMINRIQGKIRNRQVENLIEEAGCPYHSDEQLLLDNVCLMPNYKKNHPPVDSDGLAIVDTDWWIVPQLLDVDERKNRITIQLDQYMEWIDPRITINISAIKQLENLDGWIKFSQSEVEKIWHPNLDMHTFNLQEWKSLYDPLWFHSVGINRCPWLRDCENAINSSNIFADKKWKLVLFCMFNFSSFPFDTQHCKFRQTFESSSDIVKIFTNSPSVVSYLQNFTGTKPVTKWQYIMDGFEIKITPIGDIIIPDLKTQNSTGKGYGFDIKLQRLVQPYIFQYYFPSAAIVVVSQISFIIPLSSIPGRVGLVVTQFLTLTNIFIYQMVSSLSD